MGFLTKEWKNCSKQNNFQFEAPHCKFLNPRPSLGLSNTECNKTHALIGREKSPENERENVESKDKKKRTSRKRDIYESSSRFNNLNFSIYILRDSIWHSRDSKA